MSPLVLVLTEPPGQRCDLSPLTPDRLAGATASVQDIEIGTTKRRLRVGDLFQVAPGDVADIRFEGGSERFDRIGEGMTAGRITVAGDAGQLLGRAMTGGVIAVSGQAGRLAGSGMAGGRIDVGGAAGDLAGGPLPGEMTGMRGGLLRIGGDAGARAGDRMRRGLIVIGGAGGANLASRMIGGTIVCCGRAGENPGVLMRRGTVILGGGAATIGPTFLDTGAHELVVLRLIARWLVEQGIEGASLLARRFRRLVGDTATLGKGEMFISAGE